MHNHYWRMLAVLLLSLLIVFVISAQDATTIEVSVYFDEESLVIIVEANQETDETISLLDFGFNYQHYDEPGNTKLKNYGGFEPVIQEVAPGECIVIQIEEEEGPYPQACREIIAAVIVHNYDRFWYDADADQYRQITFSNEATDQTCVMRSFRCEILFSLDGDLQALAPEDLTPPDENAPGTMIVDEISAIVREGQSMIRNGPGTEYAPYAGQPAINEGEAITITGQYVDLETRQRWYRVEVTGANAWVFGPNLRVDLAPGEVIRWVPLTVIPPLETKPDSDGDGVPDIEDSCPFDPNASRRSECPDEQAGGINVTANVAPLPTVPPPPVRVVTATPTPSIATETATAEEQVQACTITPSTAAGANIRSQPNTCFRITGALPYQQSVAPVGQANVNGQTWWQVSNGWIAGEAVNASGNCATVPVVGVSGVCPVTPTPTPTDTPVFTHTPLPAPSVSASITNRNDDGTLPYGTSVNYTLGRNLTAGEELWVVVNAPDGSYWAWGPGATIAGSHWMTVNLSNEPANDCGQSFGITVIIATAGTVQSNVGYGAMPTSIASVGAGGGAKGGDTCP